MGRFYCECTTPFLFFENSAITKHVKHDKISLSTLMHYLPRLTHHVEKKIANELPDNFALVLDGWPTDSTHCLAIFASFETTTSTKYRTRLLAFSPLSNECRLDGEEHVQFIKYVMELFGKSLDDITCLIGDNCSFNNSISLITDIPMIGCASHRFNLAVCDILGHESEIIEKIHQLMVKLRALL